MYSGGLEEQRACAARCFGATFFSCSRIMVKWSTFHPVLTEINPRPPITCFGVGDCYGGRFEARKNGPLACEAVGQIWMHLPLCISRVSSYATRRPRGGEKLAPYSSQSFDMFVSGYMYAQRWLAVAPYVGRCVMYIRRGQR